MDKKVSTKVTEPTLTEGKIPPQSIDVEEVILGALMLEKEALIKIADILTPQTFYKEAHQHIYQAIINLSNREEPIDILTVNQELKKMKKLDIVGGEPYIFQLTNNVATAAHIENHALIVLQKYIRRQLIKVSSQINQLAYEEDKDVADLLDTAQQEIYQVVEGTIRQDVTHISNVVDETLNSIALLKDQKDGLRGAPSGFTELDRITSGWQKSDLIIIAARPGMGKTAFGLTMARNMAIDHHKPVAIFSMEMSSKQLANRLIACETGLEQSKIRDGRIASYEWEQIQTRINKLVKAPIYIDDTPALSIFELRAKCRRLKLKHNIEAVFVDYLQLMNTGGIIKRSITREQEVSLISHQLKVIARELDIPVIALSQLNRSIETRRDSKEPRLSDLRESGAIEQDADLVLFIYRPEEHQITEDIDGNSLIGIAHITVAKHRNGRTGRLNLRFKKEIARFMDLEEEGLPFIENEGEFFSKINKKNDLDNESPPSYN